MLETKRQNIKLYDDWYLGLVSQGDDSVPLGFLTPYGQTQADKKRMTTVDSWVKHGTDSVRPCLGTKKINASSLMSGFKFGQEIRRYGSRYGGHGNVVWRIEDPRGFELEISSECLASLLMDSGMMQGELIGKFCWARLNGQNILINEKSELYKQAVEDTENQSKKFSNKDLKPGQRVLFKNKEELTFIGRGYETNWNGNYYYEGRSSLVQKKVYIFACRHTRTDGGVSFMYRAKANPEIVKVIDVETPEELSMYLKNMPDEFDFEQWDSVEYSVEQSGVTHRKSTVTVTPEGITRKFDSDYYWNSWGISGNQKFPAYQYKALIKFKNRTKEFKTHSY